MTIERKIMSDGPVRSTFSIVDRRKNPGKKSIGNVERFKRRAKADLREKAKQTVDNLVKDGSLKDLSNGQVTVKGKLKTMDEPTFSHDMQIGEHNRVLPGNERFTPGDTIPKPPNDGGNGKQGGDQGGGEDDFEWALTRKEFMDVLFDGWQLPDLAKLKLGEEKKPKRRNAGTYKGYNPSRLDIKKTASHAMGRRIGLGAPHLDRQIAYVVEEIMGEGGEVNARAMQRYSHFILRPKPPASAKIEPVDPNIVQPKDGETRIDALQRTLAELMTRRGVIQYIEPSTDPQTRLSVPNPQPVINAAMFCLMDVSGSMGEKEKDMAKRFFALEFLFLETIHPDVKVRFIRHAETAQEVDEETFFKGRATGGTVSSTALIEMKKIIDKDYGPDWNIYGSYVGDGGTMYNDVTPTHDLLRDQIMPLCQHFAYLEIKSSASAADSTLMDELRKVVNHRLALKSASDVSQIYAVLKSLFEGKGTLGADYGAHGRRAAALEL